MRQLILKVDEGSEIGIPMNGTKIIKGNKIVLFCGDYAPEDSVVLATEGVTIKPKPLLKFFVPVAIFDDEGNQTGTEKVTDLTGKLQTFAGHTWTHD